MKDISKIRVAAAASAIAIGMTIGAPISASAVEVDSSHEVNEIELRYVGVMSAWCDLSISNYIAEVQVGIRGKPDYSYTVDVVLEKKSGSRWSTVKSWMMEGTKAETLHETYEVSPGTYRISTDVVVYDSSGREVDSFSQTSTTERC